MTTDVPETEPAAPPSGDESEPRWPAWYGPVAFLSGLVATFIAVIAVQVAITIGGGKASASSLTQTALWAGCAYLAFFVFELLYAVVLNPTGKQSVTKELGVNRGMVELIAGAFVVLVIAPIAEEFFFRGFFYRALRSRFNVLAAATIDGIVFGAIHYTGTSTLEIVPILMVLGFTFCIVYERTGTLYATIALHAINNALALAYSKIPHAGPVSAAFGGAMIVAAAVATRVSPAGPRRAAR